MVTIDGVEYTTRIDDDGSQRFMMKRITQLLMETSSIDFNQLWVMHRTGMITQEEMMELYRDIGMSVCGFADMFTDCKIENPLWDEE